MESLSIRFSRLLSSLSGLLLVSLVCTPLLIVLFAGNLEFGYAGEKEKNAAAKFERLGGKVRRDVDGTIQLLLYLQPKLTINLSDADVESVDFQSFSKVGHLLLVAPEITDRSLAEFTKIGELGGFDLIQTKMTDKGLVPFLKKHKSVYMVHISGSAITDESLVELGKLAEMRLLTLSGLQITDAGLAHLSNLLVVNLELTQMAIGDKGIAEITKMQKLIHLNLSGTKVTDMGIVQLAALPNLKYLDIRSTKVTNHGAESLQKLLPNLKIVRD